MPPTAKTAKPQAAERQELPSPTTCMAASLRLLPFQIADGPSNMAADEALLTSAAAGAASLRFYGWSSPTLSLGYFQPSVPAPSYPLLAGLPWLRRPTGGAALVHHHELTYALALPPGRAWQSSGAGWPTRMHELFRTVLAGFGIATRLCDEERKLGEVLCFLHHTQGDLLLGSHKIAGSAQRKHRGPCSSTAASLLPAVRLPLPCPASPNLPACPRPWTPSRPRPRQPCPNHRMAHRTGRLGPRGATAPSGGLAAFYLLPLERPALTGVAAASRIALIILSQLPGPGLTRRDAPL